MKQRYQTPNLEVNSLVFSESVALLVSGIDLTEENKEKTTANITLP